MPRTAITGETAGAGEVVGITSIVPDGEVTFSFYDAGGISFIFRGAVSEDVNSHPIAKNAIGWSTLVFVGLQKPLGGDGLLFAAGDTFFKLDGNVSPDLDGEDNGRRQEQSSDGYVHHGGDDHGEFGLDGIFAPHDSGDERQETQAQLADHQAEHEDCGTFDRFHVRVDRNGSHRRPGQNDRDHRSVDDMRPPAQAFMTKHGAQKELDIEHENREQSQSEEAGAAGVEFNARLFFHPTATGEDGNRHGNAEKGLRHGGVGAGDGSGQEEQNGEASEDSLEDDRSERGHGEEAQPAALFDTPRPDGENDGQQSDELGYHAMTVLIFHTADHVRHFVKRAEGGGPVGN